MNKKNIILVTVLVLCILFVLFVESFDKQSTSDYILQETGLVTNIEETLDVSDSKEPVSIIASYPTLDNASVSGKIAYWDINQHALVIAEADFTDQLLIPYNTKKGFVPNFSISLQWAPDGEMIAFGCLDAANNDLAGICILDLLEYIKNNKGEDISKNIDLIELPYGYITDRFNSRITSLEWTYNGDYIVLTPFCLLDVDKADLGCSNQQEITSNNSLFLENAYYIAPSPADPNLWAVSVENQLYLGDPAGEDFQLIETEKSSRFVAVSWSHDGEQIAFLSESNMTSSKNTSSLGVISKNGVNLNKMLAVIDLKDRIDPNLVITQQSPIILGNFTHINRYPPRQNLSWSPDNRYIALSVFYYFLKMDPVLLDAAGIFYFDTNSEKLLPAKVDFKDLQLYASPDWYACNDIENVCELYK